MTPAEQLETVYELDPIKGVHVRLDDISKTNRTVELANIQAVPRGRGKGTEALTRLTRLADRLDIRLTLVPTIIHGPARHQDLIRLYSRFGFIMDGSFMTREPQYLTHLAFDWQDTHQELVIHAGWEHGNSFRYVLEGTGDIFRSASDERADKGYIAEKVRRIERFFRDVDEGTHPGTGIHPEDSREYAFEHNRSRFVLMLFQWELQPVHSPLQYTARDLNIAMLSGEWTTARRLLKRVKDMVGLR